MTGRESRRRNGGNLRDTSHSLELAPAAAKAEQRPDALMQQSESQPKPP